MAKQKTVDVKVLKNILTEADSGLEDKNRNIDVISDSTTKKIVKKGSKAIEDVGGGGIAAATAAASGVGAAAVAMAAMGAGAGTAGISATVVGFTALNAAGGAAAILGGPVGWVIGGTLIIGSFIVGKVIGEQKKQQFDLQKETLKQEAIAKQNRIIKEQERVIKELIKKQNEASKHAAQKDNIIEALIKRIDYLNGVIVALQAVSEACA